MARGRAANGSGLQPRQRAMGSTVRNGHRSGDGYDEIQVHLWENLG